MKLTAFPMNPSPASKFMALVMEGRAQGGAHEASDSADTAHELNKATTAATATTAAAAAAVAAAAGGGGGGGGGGAMSEGQAAALLDMLRLGPLLQTLLSLLGEPEAGVDGGAVQLLQQVSSGGGGALSLIVWV